MDEGPARYEDGFFDLFEVDALEVLDGDEACDVLFDGDDVYVAAQFREDLLE